MAKACLATTSTGEIRRSRHLNVSETRATSPLQQLEAGCRTLPGPSALAERMRLAPPRSPGDQRGIGGNAARFAAVDSLRPTPW